MGLTKAGDTTEGEVGYGLGTFIVLCGVMTALHPVFPHGRARKVPARRHVFTTLSFLITTLECLVPPLGGAEHGFPWLAGPGRLVIKDVIMMGAAIVTMADSAKAYLRNKRPTAACCH